jgi:hypothetical protein
VKELERGGEGRAGWRWECVIEARGRGKALAYVFYINILNIVVVHFILLCYATTERYKHPPKNAECRTKLHNTNQHLRLINNTR